MNKKIICIMVLLFAISFVASFEHPGGEPPGGGPPPERDDRLPQDQGGSPQDQGDGPSQIQDDDELEEGGSKKVGIFRRFFGWLVGLFASDEDSDDDLLEIVGDDGVEAEDEETSYSITVKGEVWADNWFALYLDDELIMEDSVSINTERSFNSETFTFDATYPINLNFIVKDFKEDDTGLEYIGTDRQQMGDGGFIAQFTDVATGEIIAVTDENVKCRIVHQAPLDKSCEDEANPVAGQKPCEFIINSEPGGWKTINFDDSGWLGASVYTESQVSPKEGYYDISWDSSAELIWGSNLEEDNTLLCRMTIVGDSDITTITTGLVIDGCIRTVGNAELIKCDDEEIIIESNGLPLHEVMIGIAQGGWNGQWPEAQDYTGSNAFMLPGTPVLSSSPTIIVSNAAGVTANGIPIFLPQSPGKEGSADCLNIEVTGGAYASGECIRDPVIAGEMDECGGHTGRGNDYHYHESPKCLLEEFGDDEIVGYMLDGIPVYKSVREGSEPYDDCGGYISPEGEVHYAFTESYPYVTNCLLGKFNEGPRTDGHDVNTGGIDDKNVGSIAGYYIDSEGCARMTFSSGLTIIHCYDHHEDSNGASSQTTTGSTGDGGQKYCGDGICDGSETSSTCSEDC